MWWIERLICMGWLIVTSVMDIKEKRISVSLIVGGGIAAIGIQLISGEVSLWTIIGGIGIGILFLVISKVTGEGIGYGDSLGILVLGIYLGIWRLLELLCMAFSLAFLISMYLFLKNQRSKKCAFPFFPFLALGYTISFLIEFHTRWGM